MMEKLELVGKVIKYTSDSSLEDFNVLIKYIKSKGISEYGSSNEFEDFKRCGHVRIDSEYDYYVCAYTYKYTVDIKEFLKELTVGWCIKPCEQLSAWARKSKTNYSLDSIDQYYYLENDTNLEMWDFDPEPGLKKVITFEEFENKFLKNMTWRDTLAGNYYIYHYNPGCEVYAKCTKTSSYKAHGLDSEEKAFYYDGRFSAANYVSELTDADLIAQLEHCISVKKFVSKGDVPKEDDWWKNAKVGDYIVSLKKRTEFDYGNTSAGYKKNHVFKVLTICDYKDHKILFPEGSASGWYHDTIRPATDEEIRMYDEAGSSVDVTTYEFKKVIDDPKTKWFEGSYVLFLRSTTLLDEGSIRDITEDDDSSSVYVREYGWMMKEREDNKEVKWFATKQEAEDYKKEHLPERTPLKNREEIEVTWDIEAPTHPKQHIALEEIKLETLSI